MTDDANDLEDLKLALGLLHGSLSPDESEDEARNAIVRLLCNLREPVDSAIRLKLAALFDPETDTNRKIKFVERRGRRDEGRSLQIANAVADLRFRDAEEGTSLSRQEAINQVAEDFNVSTRYVETAMERFKSLFDPIEQSWTRGYPGETKRLREESRARRREPVISLKRRTERK